MHLSIDCTQYLDLSPVFVHYSGRCEERLTEPLSSGSRLPFLKIAKHE